MAIISQIARDRVEWGRIDRWVCLTFGSLTEASAIVNEPSGSQHQLLLRRKEGRELRGARQSEVLAIDARQGMPKISSHVEIGAHLFSVRDPYDV